MAIVTLILANSPQFYPLPLPHSSGQYYKNFMIINYDRKVHSKLWHHLLTMLESWFMILAKPRIIIYSFILLATVITIVNYDRTVITIINYDHKTFMVQATDWWTFKSIFFSFSVINFFCSWCHEYLAIPSLYFKRRFRM